jgi:hypothetical protein
MDDAIDRFHCCFDTRRIPHITGHWRESIQLIGSQIEEGGQFVGAPVKTLNIKAFAGKSLN